MPPSASRTPRRWSTRSRADPVDGVPDSNLHRLRRTASPYPATLQRYLGGRAPAVVTARGNVDILRTRMLALFCSVRCPGDLIVKTYDLARSLRDAGVPVIGGFHSPMEKECLTLLLRGKQPVAICLARALENVRLPGAWRAPLAEGRLLLLSPFSEKHHRVVAELATIRNKFVAAIADEVFIAYAGAGSKTEQLCREVLAWDKPVLTLDDPRNGALIALGAKPVQPHQARRKG